MLVLTRKEQETIIVDGPCTIKLVRIEGSKVRIGIVAAPSVNVIRGELVRDKQNEIDEAMNGRR